MSFKEILKVYDAGAVIRFHTRRMINQTTVGQHSWGVCTVLLAICEPSVELLKAAIFHDVAEVRTGDIPYPAKRRYPDLKAALDEAEADFEQEHGIVTTLTAEELKLLKWADMFELLLNVIVEMQMGNKAVVDVLDTALEVLKHTPNGAASDLLLDIRQEYNL